MSMLLVHTKCGNQIKVDACSLATILGGISISSRGATITELRLSKISSFIVNPKFVCLHCGNLDVQKEAIVFACMYCSSTVPLSEACIPDKSNGVYCPACFSRKFSDEGKLNFDELIKKIYLR